MTMTALPGQKASDMEGQLQIRLVMSHLVLISKATVMCLENGSLVESLKASLHSMVVRFF